MKDSVAAHAEKFISAQTKTQKALWGSSHGSSGSIRRFRTGAELGPATLEGKVIVDVENGRTQRSTGNQGGCQARECVCVSVLAFIMSVHKLSRLEPLHSAAILIFHLPPSPTPVTTLCSGSQRESFQFSLLVELCLAEWIREDMSVSLH